MSFSAGIVVPASVLAHFAVEQSVALMLRVVLLEFVKGVRVR
jgi:hypothetical protein